MIREQHLPAGLTALLARAREYRLEPSWAHGQLVIGHSARISPAALSRLHDRPDDAHGFWMRADPLALAVDLATIRVVGPASLPQEPGLRKTMEEALTGLFAAGGIEYQPAGPGHGYLRLEDPPACRFTPPWRLAGARLDQVLPEGPGAKMWHRLLNETQMLFHDLPAPHSLAPSRRPAGLWFWGAGSLPAARPGTPLTALSAAGDPIICGLAEWLGIAPDAGADLARDEAGHRLVQWRPDTARTRRENLEILITRLIDPAWRALRRFKLKQLRLSSLERCFCLGPAESWRFWHRSMDRA